VLSFKAEAPSGQHDGAQYQRHHARGGHRLRAPETVGQFRLRQRGMEADYRWRAAGYQDVRSTVDLAKVAEMISPWSQRSVPCVQ